jgi:hypothetical protein
MAGQPQGSKITTDHDIIKRWIQEREGRPATIEGHEEEDGPEALRVKFEDIKNENEKLETIGWDQFFEYFDDEHFAFLYQDETVDGEVSHFYRFINH